MLAWHPQARYSKIGAIYLASPLAYIMMGWIPLIVMLVLLYVLAYEVWSAGRSSEKQMNKVPGF
jgi:CHASE2 domain-containing sensor protein